MSKPLPVFDASSEFHQNLGLLKVAEMAMRKHGDAVIIRASEVRDMVLLTGADSVRYWKSHQGHFQTELGDIASNAAISRMLLGDALERSENTEIWDATRSRLTEVNAVWDDWAHRALVYATRKLMIDIHISEGPMDLRQLCRLWSIRALAPALLGTTLPDHELADGLMKIEQFYFAMSTKDAEATRTPDNMIEFQAARGFLDKAVEVAIANMMPCDDTVIALLDKALPADVSLAERIAFLRPTIGRILLEKLNIDGLGLLWTLTHLAQDPSLADEIARELVGCDFYNLPDEQTPLTFSVVCEGQRMYPELPFIYRITSQNIGIFDHVIPARTTVVFSPWLVHRDARYWSDPSRFDGRRFLAPMQDKSSYLPFGIGPRVKSRTQFLQHQLSVAVRAVVSRYRLTLTPECPPGNLRPILRSTLAPRGAVTVTFSERHRDGMKWQNPKSPDGTPFSKETNKWYRTC